MICLRQNNIFKFIFFPNIFNTIFLFFMNPMLIKTAHLPLQPLPLPTMSFPSLVVLRVYNLLEFVPQYRYTFPVLLKIQQSLPILSLPHHTQQHYQKKPPVSGVKFTFEADFVMSFIPPNENPLPSSETIRRKKKLIPNSIKRGTKRGKHDQTKNLVFLKQAAEKHQLFFLINSLKDLYHLAMHRNNIAPFKIGCN